MLIKVGKKTKNKILICIVASFAMQSLVVQAELLAMPVVPLALSSEQNSQLSLQAKLPVGVRLYYPALLAKLYTANQMQPLWQDKHAQSQFQQQLAELAISGIQPQFSQWVKTLLHPEIGDMARDIVLTDALLGYLQFISSLGGEGYHKLYRTTLSQLPAPASVLVNSWLQAVEQHRTLNYINRLEPQHPQYKKMQRALRAVLADQQPWPRMKESVSLRPGQRSSDLPMLREILLRTEMLKPTPETIPRLLVSEVYHNPAMPLLLTGGTSSSASQSKRVVADKYYGEELVDAVKQFQQWHGLTPDGVIGSQTRAWLNTSQQQRAALLALNMQRLRILPGNVKTAIMVNIPNYSLSYYLNGREVLASNVIVGMPKRKTPLMNSSLNSVVINPPWNVPVKLIREDILPKARRDPSYLVRHRYRVFSGNSVEHGVVDPTSIDWSSVSTRNFPYRLQQAPGADNSLGLYKFNMPNSKAIYLHDTPKRELFDKDIRALSSGCVRVGKAEDLAQMLLNDAGWDNARISATLKRGKTTHVDVQQQIPVRLYYLTAWVDEQEKPQYRTDIYHYDISVKMAESIITQAKQLML
ncbi:L,D-transpeptidase [Serratia microhaemolytica]|uniref:L,D-transpeptidase n=1 Tax=Serratia microhaemolytica TaxID=2675110 RepID=UPI003B835249